MVSLAARSMRTLWAVRLWGRFFSVPCCLLRRELRFGLGCFRWLPKPDLDLHRTGCRGGHAPGGSGELDGQGNDGLVARHSCDCPRQPWTEAEVGPPVLTHHDHLRRLHEQHEQIPTAAFRDASEDCAPTGFIVWAPTQPKLRSRDLCRTLRLYRSPPPSRSRSSGRSPEC